MIRISDHKNDIPNNVVCSSNNKYVWHIDAMWIKISVWLRAAHKNQKYAVSYL